MTRTLLLSLLTIAAGAFSCSPCARVAAAEANVTQNGKDCSAGDTSWTSAHVQACEAKLKDCSESDLTKYDDYTKCLNGLTKCESGKQLSWGISRLECTGKLSGVSFNCLSAFAGN